MRILFILLLSSIFVSFKIVGSGTAHLTCKSESGRTIFTAELEDIDGLLEKAELIVDNKKLTFDATDEAHTIFDAQSGVFTVYLTGESTDNFPNGRFIQFWAIPKSFKIISADRSYQKYEFKARIEATEPRRGENRSLRTPQVELNCTLTYRI